MVAKKKELHTLKRGSIIKVSFDPTVGHEQAGYRPALIVSDMLFHSKTGFAFCIPLTSKQKCEIFTFEVTGAEIHGYALPQSTRMLDLQNRPFKFVELATKESLEKAQAIISKIITS
jgi:mRNA interferase MazF